MSRNTIFIVFWHQTDNRPKGPTIEQKAINRFPAAFSDELPLFVVGAVNNVGYINPSTQYTSSTNFPNAQANTFAPGFKVECDQKGGGSQELSGTSIG